MFVPNKHSKMCKTPWSGFAKESGNEKPVSRNTPASAKTKQNENKTSPRARVHTCPKWTVIGLRSSRSFASLASTSGDGTVFGSCSSAVGAQPFSVMSYREKPVGVGVGVKAPAASRCPPPTHSSGACHRTLPLGCSQPLLLLEMEEAEG